jgi:hypothetical protein
MGTHTVQEEVALLFDLPDLPTILLLRAVVVVVATPPQVAQVVDSLDKTAVQVQGMEVHKLLVEQRQTPNLA